MHDGRRLERAVPQRSCRDTVSLSEMACAAVLRRTRCGRRARVWVWRGPGAGALEGAYRAVTGVACGTTS